MSKENILLAIRKYITTNYKKLNIDDFEIGDAPFNKRCHLNSVQKVKEGKAEKVFLCFSIDKDNNSQCVHFINQLENGKYQDNTCGWLYEHSEYYLMKEIDKTEQEKIWDILMNTKEMLINLHSNRFLRFIYRIDTDVI